MTPLGRYQLAARVVGVALVVLVAVGVPLQLLAGAPQVVHVLGPVHGFLYLAYLATVVDVARRYRLSTLQILAMVGAGLVPLLTFVVERRMVGRLTRPVSQKSQVGDPQ